MRERPEPLPRGPGRESVWTDPRFPRLQRTERHPKVVFAGEVIADTRGASQALETSHPPGYYLPLANVRETNAAWHYPDPSFGCEPLRDHVAFCPGCMEECYPDDELVCPQPGGFYGG